MMNRNTLDKEKYIISEDLYKALENEHIGENSSQEDVSKKLGIYLVAFRVLNKKNNTLIYNYLYYDPLFLEAFMAFLPFRNFYSIRYAEWGDTSIIFNENVFLNNSKYSKIKLSDFKDDDYRRIKYIFTNQEEFNYSLRHLGDYYVESITQQLVNSINKLTYTVSNEDMIKIFGLALNKEYKSYINTIISPLKDLSDINESIEDKPKVKINLLNSCLFIVRDLKSFIGDLNNQGHSVNEGPQPWRGQINSINGLLNSIDMDFRNSLYNHSLYHVKKGTVSHRFALDKSKFSFRNIHMNLGNVRWYSTTKTKSSATAVIRKKKENRISLSEKILKKINRNSFKTDSDIYLYLGRYLKESPINEETQRNIEKFLLDYSYLSLKDKDNKSNSNIKYDLFKNIKIKDYIAEGSEMIDEYLSNFKKKSYSISSTSSQKTRTRYYFNNILNVINISIISEISLGMLVRILSNVTHINEDCSRLKICIDIGDTIIKHYLYVLYKKKVVEGVLLFCNECEKCLKYKHINIDDEDRKYIIRTLKEINKKINDLEVYDLLKLVNNILHIKSVSLINFNNTDSISKYTLSDWKLDEKTIVSQYEDDTDLKVGIGAIIIDWLIESKLIESKTITITKNKSETFLIPYKTLVKLLDDNKGVIIKHLPIRIPMIVKPKLYYREVIKNNSKERLGGYLLNDERFIDKIIIPNWELKQDSLIQDPNVLYDLVNNINSVGFKINTDLLDFLNLYDDKLGLLMDNIDLKKDISKISKSEFSELESYLSKLDLQENILGLAKVYSTIHEFYLPVRMDFRGRVNCISQYLNYQSTELAKALLLFSKGEKLMKNDNIGISFFKAYGANCFGNKLDKKSWADRCKWINENEQDIINYTNCHLISKADNKLLFTAFCIEYNKWLRAYNDIEISYFETHLPIQLDATCNGYQHLSLLISDIDMAKELNLTKSSWDDIPKDFYGFMGMKLLDLFKDKLKFNKLSKEDKACYERLSNMLVLRSTIKKAIMTIPYNVSVYQMIRYLKEHFINIGNGNANGNSWSPYKLEYQYKEDSNLILCNKDITYIASGLKEVLEINFPKLKLFIIYLKIIAKICNKLNIVIPWGTPSGLIVHQSYLSSKEIKLRPFSYNKSIFTLKVKTKNLSGSKQIRAFMPNLIHSLDATVLALLTDDLFNNYLGITNFYAIHDCFAVTANNVSSLFNSLKSSYTKVYTQDIFLKELDNFIIQYIKFTFGKECFDDKSLKIRIETSDETIEEQYPNINYILGKELPPVDLIKDSSYLIS